MPATILPPTRHSSGHPNLTRCVIRGGDSPPQGQNYCSLRQTSRRTKASSLLPLNVHFASLQFNLLPRSYVREIPGNVLPPCVWVAADRSQPIQSVRGFVGFYCRNTALKEFISRRKYPVVVSRLQFDLFAPKRCFYDHFTGLSILHCYAILTWNSPTRTHTAQVEEVMVGGQAEHPQKRYD